MPKKPTNNYNIEEIQRVYNTTGNHILSRTAKILGYKKGAFTGWVNRNYDRKTFFIKKNREY